MWDMIKTYGGPVSSLLAFIIWPLVSWAIRRGLVGREEYEERGRSLENRVSAIESRVAAWATGHAEEHHLMSMQLSRLEGRLATMPTKDEWGALRHELDVFSGSVAGLKDMFRQNEYLLRLTHELAVKGKD